ncbi:MAG: TylF/MycF/NovP-related O-methyltransferase [Oscillospiraceae bacterium]|nr:TylF/MycF/NovP-related O-methyltransferase [Oscillospiraceae bacterium]
MKKLVIAGAGQMGQMALKFVNRAQYQIIGFADNNSSLQEDSAEDLPVFSFDEALGFEPDCVLIAVMGEERADEIEAQLRHGGFKGELRRLRDFSRDLDVRGALLSLLKERIDPLEGDMAELGVYRGDFASRINALFPRRKLYLFDTFQGFDPGDIETERERGFSAAKKGDFSDTSLETVLLKMPSPESVVLRAGRFPDTAAGLEAVFSLVSLDADLYEPTLAGLRWFYPRMTSGGVILLHDCHNRRYRGVRAAVDSFEKEAGRLLLLPVCDLHGSVMLVRP